MADRNVLGADARSAENIARVIYDELRPVVAERSTAQVVRIGVRETGKNTFSYGDTA